MCAYTDILKGFCVALPGKPGKTYFIDIFALKTRMCCELSPDLERPDVAFRTDNTASLHVCWI